MVSRIKRRNLRTQRSIFKLNLWPCIIIVYFCNPWTCVLQRNPQYEITSIMCNTLCCWESPLHLFLLEIRENLSVILDYFFTLFESAVIQFTRMFFPIYKSKSNSKLFKYEYNIYDNVQKIFLWEQFWTYHHKIRISGKNSISTICYKNDR